MPGNPFHANVASTANGAVSSTNAVIALLNPSNGPSNIRVLYIGTGTVFIRRSTSSGVTADATVDIPIAAGQPEVFSLNNATGGSGAVTHFGAITAGADAGKLYITTGDGY